MSTGAWDLRHPGLIMKDGKREVREFLGMWPLKPGADLLGLTNTLSREAPFLGGPGKTFSEPTTRERPGVFAQNVQVRERAPGRVWDPVHSQHRFYLPRAEDTGSPPTRFLTAFHDRDQAEPPALSSPFDFYQCPGAFDGGRSAHSVSTPSSQAPKRRARMVEQSSTLFCLNWRESGWTRWIRLAFLEIKASQVQVDTNAMAQRLKVDLQKRLCNFHAMAKKHVESGCLAARDQNSWRSIGTTSKRKSDVHRDWRQADRAAPGNVPGRSHGSSKGLAEAADKAQRADSEDGKPRRRADDRWPPQMQARPRGRSAPAEAKHAGSESGLH
jgi:hypothetical protein